MLEKTLESPLDCKEVQSVHPKGDQSCSLEGLMLKLKLQYFGHLMRRVDLLERLWFWEGLRAGGEEYDREWDGCMASPTRWTWVSVNSGTWWWTGRPGVLRFMGWQRVGHDWVTELNWTEESYSHQIRASILLTQYVSLLFDSHIVKKWNLFLAIHHKSFRGTHPLFC